MADTNIPVTGGTGYNVDGFQLANTNVRQAVVIGDSSVVNNVAPVQATDPASNAQGVVVRDVNTSAIVAKLNSGVAISGFTGSLGVYFDRGEPTVIAKAGSGTFSVQLDPGHTLGKVDAGIGTFNVSIDPGHELGSVKGINSSVAVYFDRGEPTVVAKAGSGTFAVQLDPGHTLGIIDSITKTVTVQLDPGYTLGKVDAGAGSFTVRLDPGHELGSIKSINQTVAVYFDPATPSVAATFSGTMAAYFDQSNPAVTAYGLDGTTKIGLRMNSDGAIKIYELANGTVSIGGFTSSIGVYFDRGNPTVTANAGAGSLTVQLDPGHELGTIRGNSNTLTVFLPDTGHELGSIRGNTNTLTVFMPDTGHELGSIRGINSTVAVYFSPATPSVAATFSGTTAVYFDQSNPAITAYGLDGATKRAIRMNSDGAIKVYELANGTVSIGGSTGTMGVYVGSILETVAVIFRNEPTVVSSGKDGTTTRPIRMNSDGAIKVYDLANGTVAVSGVTGTVGVRFSDEPYVVAEGKYGTTKTPILVNTDGAIKVYDIANGSITVNNPSLNVYDLNGTATSYYVASGSYAGSSDLGVTVIAPIASRNSKIYAIQLTTTAQVGMAVQFTNGAGSATEFWRYALQAPSQGVSGANLSVTPPAYLFATGTQVTLSIVTKNASLIHYSVAYFRETA